MTGFVKKLDQTIANLWIHGGKLVSNHIIIQLVYQLVLVQLYATLILYAETGGIAIIIEHSLADLPTGNFPAKPFFGVDPVINDIHHASAMIHYYCHDSSY